MSDAQGTMSEAAATSMPDDHHAINTENKSLVVILAGPTGVGKSDVAARLCESERGFVVSADSVQAYTHVSIGANKPSRKEQLETPHILIDVAHTDERYNAAEWRNDALFCIEKLLRRIPAEEENDKQSNAPERRKGIEKYIHDSKTSKGYNDSEIVLPIICGGTMMYLQWLVHGKPDAMRPTEHAVSKAKSKIAELQSNGTWEEAVQYVSSLGEIFATRTTKFFDSDWYRLERTLEIAYTYLKSDDKEGLLENMYTGEREGSLVDMGYDVRCFFLCPDDRMSHTAVVDQRCEQMITRGLLKETSDLSLAGHLPDMASRAIGYRQTLDYLNRENPSEARKEKEFDAFIDNFTAVTRRYAKKQMSWFRKDESFLFVPVSVSEEKKSKVQKSAARIRDLIHMSRSEYDAELQSSESESAKAKATNEAQGKGMKFYQPSRYILKPDSDAYRAAIDEAMECTSRMQAKRKRKDSEET